MRFDVLGAIIFAALAAGCMAEPALIAASEGPQYHWDVARHLPGATDHRSELGGLIHVERATVVPQLTAEPIAQTREKLTRLGLRGGMTVTTAAEQGEWDPALKLGAYVRRGRLDRGLMHEFGLDMLTLSATVDGGEVDSTIVALRYEMLAGKGGAVGAYFAVGGEIGMEEAVWTATGTSASRIGGAVNVGLGLGAAAWDARVTYSLVPGASNSSGALGATLGFAF